MIVEQSALEIVISW